MQADCGTYIQLIFRLRLYTGLYLTDVQYYMYPFTFCDVIICRPMHCTLLLYVLFVNQEEMIIF